MRIEKTNSSGAVSSAKKKQANAGASGFGDMMNVADDSGQAVVGGASPLVNASSIDALLSVQEMGSATDKTRKRINQGEDMLRDLENLRDMLLKGNISAAAAKEVAQRARSKVEKSDDPELEEILSDIELRVEVELAKLEMSGLF